MNICKSKAEYINAIYPAVQRCCKRYGYLPSVLIAQSCLENGYGVPEYWDNKQIELLMKYNNMVGIKSDLLTDSWADKSVWPGKSLSKKTPEVYNGKKVTIDDDFRKYDDIEQSFADYLLFMKYGAYSKGGKPRYGDAVLSMKDPAKLIKKVNDLGYATGKTYATSVMRIVNENNLTRFDDLTGVTETIYSPGYKSKSAKKDDSTPAPTQTAKGKKVMLDAGHYGYYNQSPAVRDYWESKMTWKLHLMLKEELEKYGITVGTTRKKQEADMALYDRGYASKGYDLFLSLHSNAVGDSVNEKVDYPVCFVQISGKSDKIGTLLSQCVQSVMKTNQPADHWSLKGNNGDYYGVLRGATAAGTVGCIVEHSFHTNTRATKWLMQDANLRKLAVAEAKVIADYLAGVKGKTEPKETSGGSYLYLSKGDTGAAVKKLQEMLIACGYTCGSTGADGQFGKNTQAALKRFQKDAHLTDDGLYGEKSKTALTALYKSKTAKPSTKKSTYTKRVSSLQTIKNAMQLADSTAKAGNYTYGDSHGDPLCSDGKISCDRGVMLGNYYMGFTDQRVGGETCGTMDAYLTSHGWTKVTKKADIKNGAIVAVKNKTGGGINHVFIVTKYDAKTDKCTKYDYGSNERIRHKQPYTNVKLVEWSNKTFACAWNPPAWLCSASPNVYVFSGVDYGPVFNATYYYHMNPDLQKSIGLNKQKLFEHFLEHGMKEGRQAYAGFNPKAYKERYADLKKAFKNNWKEYYLHYITHGRDEKRIGN